MTFLFPLFLPFLSAPPFSLVLFLSKLQLYAWSYLWLLKYITQEEAIAQLMVLNQDNGVFPQPFNFYPLLQAYDRYIQLIAMLKEKRMKKYD